MGITSRFVFFSGLHTWEFGIVAYRAYTCPRFPTSDRAPCPRPFGILLHLPEFVVAVVDIVRFQASGSASRSQLFGRGKGLGRTHGRAEMGRHAWKCH